MKDGYIINFSLHHLCIYLLKGWENVLFYIRDVGFKRGPKVSAASRHPDLGAGCIKVVRPKLQTSELGRPFILRQLHQSGRHERSTQLRREINVWSGGGVDLYREPIFILPSSNPNSRTQTGFSDSR